MTWGLVAAAGGTIIGGLISSSGASSAANTQAQGATDAANIAANAQLQGLQLVQQQEQPYNQAGQLALSKYENLLGLGGTQAPTPVGGTPARPGSPATGPATGGLGQQQIASGNDPGTAQGFDVSKLPGYQFELQQGEQALQNSAASRGQALSGNTIQATEQFGQGLASTQFQQYMQQLAGLANMGQASASNTANQGASLLAGAGQNQAAGTWLAANAGGGAGFGGVLGQAFNLPSVQGGIQQGLSSLFSSTPSYDQTPVLPPSAFGG